MNDEGPVTKTLIGAKIEVRYVSGEDIEEIEGTYKGAQAFLSEDRYFLVLNIDKKEDIDRLIPVDNIVHVDVVKAERIEVEKETAYHG